jgi:Xaa-Pro dipeptidase
MRENNIPTAQGMVFTVEPGLYKHGELGVRIEDDIHVGPNGADCLTSLDRQLQTFG